jgi:hypothetical protein
MTYLDDSSLPQLSAEEFEADLATTRPYTLCIFDASLEDADRILSDDPAIKAQILTYELHPTRSFPLANGSAA